ncbi:SPOR domain-containing protein [Exilibacterium tricleocarpae]|uniref:SPOR domain-containing protein n=1 Tax=Exilibacterium tricleocarpae TaxID=2591008 RepID=A0A545SQY1_9GAMM|nr:SPOR domain-containing protein [Exilibacterium tricleocarpae]TQV67296.1 SPOR domain-containing protein [Exilibacterium tricleocarpae]
MRWIFLTLLLANGVILAWQLLRDPEPQAPAVTAKPVVAEREGVEWLTLLSELEGQALADMLREKGRLQLTENTGAVQGEPLCTLVGPFEKLLRAEYFIERMAALEIAAEIQDVEIPGEVGYWVYLPPEVSRKEALRRLHELQAKGVDSYVIPKGELANGISFGMFSQEALALRRQEDMVNRGYAAEIKEMARTYKETWALLRPDQAAKISEELWFQVTADNPGIERRQNFCPTVASTDNFQ